MATHVLTCQFQRDPATEHLASTPVVVDAEAVLFSWTDREGRGYQVLLRGRERLVAMLRCDLQEHTIATQELDLQCRALGLMWRATAFVEDAAWPLPAAGAFGAVPENTFATGAFHHGH